PRRGIAPVLVLVVVLVVAGASIAATAAYLEISQSSSPGGGPGTVQLVDDYGRTVSAPSDAGRVVVLGPNLVDTMVRLGLRGDLVGVDCSSASYGGLLGDYTPNQTVEWGLTPAMCVQAFPSLDTEELLNDSPQLILATSFVSESAVNEFSTTYHVPVVWLVPTSLDAIVTDVRIFGQLFPDATGAAALEGTLQSALARATSALQNLTADPNASIPAVLLTYYVDPSAGYYSYGPGTFGNSLIVLAGGRSIAAGASVPYPVLPGSEVLADAPALVIYGSGPLGSPLSSYAQGPDWGQLTSNKVALDVTLFTEADPTMILVGLPAMTNAIHPAAA
ncbi:MAG TPA: ABC transporter substrate-binding protein, partial [Thermoplasmata archaeon]|nr:ABC transporter substrate-binding protein [Thermoplasmata archaeon]